MMFYILFFLSLSLFLVYFKKISTMINLYDLPDGKRKFQTEKVSLIGGLFFYIIFIIIIFSNFFIQLISFEKLLMFYDISDLFLFLFVITFLFLVGIYDDKYELKSLSKAGLIFIVIFFYVFHMEEQFQIQELRTILHDKPIYLGKFSLFFTTMCIFCLLIAQNMFDGSNGQSFINYLIFFIYLIFKDAFIEISYLMVILIFVFGYLNLKNLVYLGDSGIYFLSFLVAYLIINSYNFNQNIYFVEEVVILFILPIIDMVRLFFIRIINGKSPFLADTNHIHHIIKKKFSEKKLFYLIIILISFPVIMLLFLDLNYYLILSIQFMMYLFFIIYKKKY